MLCRESTESVGRLKEWEEMWVRAPIVVSEGRNGQGRRSSVLIGWFE